MMITIIIYMYTSVVHASDGIPTRDHSNTCRAAAVRANVADTCKFAFNASTRRISSRHFSSNKIVA